MSKLDPKKLSVAFQNGVSVTEPVLSRKYTLTHSDTTAELFLTVGLIYDYDKITAMRDEVLGEWVLNKNQYNCYVYLHVDGQYGGYEMANKRLEIFKRELPLALEAIRFGDRVFFQAHPFLNHSPIIVFFISSFPQLNNTEYWGTFSDYEF